jgi:hypothetical protein
MEEGDWGLGTRDWLFQVSGFKFLVGRKLKLEIYTGAFMGNEDRALFIESIAEMRELKGELREFKIHVTERLQRLEKNEGQRHRDRFTVAALLVSSGMLALNFFAKLN